MCQLYKSNQHPILCVTAADPGYILGINFLSKHSVSSQPLQGAPVQWTAACNRKKEAKAITQLLLAAKSTNSSRLERGQHQLNSCIHGVGLQLYQGAA